MAHEPPAFGFGVRRGNVDFAVKLIWLVRLAVANRFDLRCAQRMKLPTALAIPLLGHLVVAVTGMAKISRSLASLSLIINPSNTFFVSVTQVPAPTDIGIYRKT